MISYTILGVPYYTYSIIYPPPPPNLILIIQAPVVSDQGLRLGFHAGSAGLTRSGRPEPGEITLPRIWVQDLGFGVIMGFWVLDLGFSYYLEALWT